MRDNFSTRLKQAEWDFSNVRDEELHLCAWWEYLKPINEAVRAIDAHRFLFHQKNQPTPKQLNESGFTESDYLIGHRLPFSFTQDAEWPNMAWNELSKERRRQIVGRYSEQWMEYDPDDVPPEIRCDLRTIGGDAAVHGGRATVNRNWIPGRIKSEEPPLDVEIVLLRLDWSLAPDRQIHDIRDWINKRRPADAQPKESRGSASSIYWLKTRLKHLGVWRLLHKMDMDWKQAADYAARFRSKPLLSDYQHVWRRAFDSAESKIESLRRQLTMEPWFPIDDYLIRAEMRPGD